MNFPSVNGLKKRAKIVSSNIPSSRLRYLLDTYRKTLTEVDELQFELHKLKFEIEKLIGPTGSRSEGVISYTVRETKVKGYARGKYTVLKIKKTNR